MNVTDKKPSKRQPKKKELKTKTNFIRYKSNYTSSHKLSEALRSHSFDKSYTAHAQGNHKKHLHTTIHNR